MKNIHELQPTACILQDPLLAHHVTRLVHTLDGFYQSGHFSGPARSLHEATSCVAEAVRSGELNKAPGIALIVNLAEMQVFICEVLEHYQAIKGLAPELARR